MPLQYESNSQPWRGERINGKSYPRSIEKAFSDDELAAIGLVRVAPAVPTATHEQLYAAAAAHRFALTEGRIEIDLGAGPVSIPTDSYMRSLIKPLYDDARADSGFTVAKRKHRP